MKISLLLCLLLGIHLQTLAQNPTSEPVPYWIQLERERQGLSPIKPQPRPQFNSRTFQRSADKEMKRVNAEFAWIKRREEQKRRSKVK